MVSFNSSFWGQNGPYYGNEPLPKPDFPNFGNPHFFGGRSFCQTATASEHVGAGLRMRHTMSQIAIFRAFTSATTSSHFIPLKIEKFEPLGATPVTSKDV